MSTMDIVRFVQAVNMANLKVEKMAESRYSCLFNQCFSSPGIKGHVSFCHHLASVHNSHFNLLLLGASVFFIPAALIAVGIHLYVQCMYDNSWIVRYQSKVFNSIPGIKVNIIYKLVLSTLF
jgi:hypothetical protein